MSIHWAAGYILILFVIAVIIFLYLHLAKPHEIETFDEEDREEQNIKELERKFVFQIKSKKAP